MITLVIGSDAVCSDGYRGEVLAAVIDPAARTVTHVVAEPKGRLGLARLVPLDLVDASPGQIRLRCTEAEFKSLEAAEETLAEFVPGYPVPVQLLPPGWRGAGGPTAEGGTIPRIPEKETHVLLREGPMWDRKDVAIPFDKVTGFDNGIRLSITRQQVRDLPPADD